MANSNRVTVQFNANSMDLGGLDGLTVGQIRATTVVAESIGLTGGETASVNSGSGFENVGDDFQVFNGDTVLFTRSSGTKG